ncbi:hypothetical protein LJB75_00340, partial [Bacteroidales bacterium OttesenSCG-928-L19]|nr:hypothetical protein [Bacteroidales bacterium OttesenSCG-928-L19]
MKKYTPHHDDKDHSQSENLDEYLEMDVRSTVSAEARKISENKFLTRGLNAPPEKEETHCAQYDYGCCKLASSNWIDKLDISTEYLDFPIAEVRFKNSHKDFYLLPEGVVLKVGNIVAVESSPGHDIGIVSMLGLDVKNQMKHKHIKEESVTKKLYRT